MKPNDQLNYKSFHKIRHEGCPFCLDQWYPLVEPITYKTYFIPLRLEQAEAITSYYKTKYFEKDEFTRQHTIILEDLEKQIDELFEREPTLKNKGAFVRLCDRSPKDGHPNNPQYFYKQYLNNLEKISKEQKLDKTKGNTKMMAIAKTNYLIVKNSEDAMSLLLSSRKVYLDMLDWQKYGGKEQLCFREFDDQLQDDNEYRVFVYENKLTAISQYDPYGKYTDCIENKEKVEKMINEYWTCEVKNRMKIDNYVVDFCFEKDKVKLIEFNPFKDSTGAGLYDWKRDAKELRYGDGKLKIVLNEYPNIDDFADCWLDAFKDAPSYKQFYKKQNIFNIFTSYVSRLWPNDNDESLLFVASVLKRGFIWNSKYLSYSKFICNGELNGFEIAIDENGMGWIVNTKKGQIKGEIWQVPKNELRDIEYFYGFCKKAIVDVNTNEKNLNNVVCFVRDEEVTESDKIVSEYTLDNQNDYNSMAHSIKLEERYLN